MELNREILKEGNSFILRIVKSTYDNENRFRRINVRKISSLKELINKPISEVTFELSSIDQLNETTLKHENNLKKSYTDAQAVTSTAEKMKTNLQRIKEELNNIDESKN